VKEFFCPNCSSPLKEVKYEPWGVFNESQFLEKRAGDFYCVVCPSNNRGNSDKCYWWKHELNSAKFEVLLGKIKQKCYEDYRKKYNRDIICISDTYPIKQLTDRKNIKEYFSDSIKYDIENYLTNVFDLGLHDYILDVCECHNMNDDEIAFTCESEIEIIQILNEFLLSRMKPIIESLINIQCFKKGL
jgi:hypothetical protein